MTGSPLARSVCIGVFTLLTGVLMAQMPRSLSYSFDYAVTGMGGGVSSSTDYSLVAVTDDNGMASPSASISNLYQLQPAVGVETVNDEPPASVEMWTLYE